MLFGFVSVRNGRLRLICCVKVKENKESLLAASKPRDLGPTIPKSAFTDFCSLTAKAFAYISVVIRLHVTSRIIIYRIAIIYPKRETPKFPLCPSRGTLFAVVAWRTTRVDISPDGTGSATFSSARTRSTTNAGACPSFLLQEPTTSGESRYFVVIR